MLPCFPGDDLRDGVHRGLIGGYASKSDFVARKASPCKDATMHSRSSMMASPKCCTVCRIGCGTVLDARMRFDDAGGAFPPTCGTAATLRISDTRTSCMTDSARQASTLPESTV